MIVEQIYTGCLAQGAYYIESRGEAAVIDPLREITPYVERAQRNGAKIKYIFETHFHADFVSGHLSLSKESGAPIVYGPTAAPAFDCIVARDGQDFQLGDVRIRAIHTPGHTLESTCYLLTDSSGKDYALFTGDTLFLGDVGRPDLAQKAGEWTMDDLAGMLYDSLRNKIFPLADDVLIYPAHGAGSACGKNMMKITVDQLGNQKKVNYALRADMTRDEFIREVTDGLLPPPAYFPMNVKMNKEGYTDIDQVIRQSAKALSPDEFEMLASDYDTLVLDVRTQDDFVKGHIPRSIFIGLNGSFAPWVGELIRDVSQKLLLVTPPGQEEEAIIRLARVGFDHVLGYLRGGYTAWHASGKETDTIESVSAEEFAAQSASKAGQPIIDVRKTAEFENEHLTDAVNIPLSELNQHLAAVPKEEAFFIHCAGGYRSVIAASMLKAKGYHNMIDVAGGFGALKNTACSIQRTSTQEN